MVDHERKIVGRGFLIPLFYEEHPILPIPPFSKKTCHGH